MIQVKQNVVLDAEMVAFKGVQVDGDAFVCMAFEFSSHLGILEFWRIRSLIETTAHGIRGRRSTYVPKNSDDDEYDHLTTIGFPNEP